MLGLHSPVFRHGEPIPARHTCEGADVSPPLEFGPVPPGTQSFVLVVDDPDVPDPAAPSTTWVHWVLYDLPADCRGLPEAVEALPPGTREGRNDWKRTGYGGPCPPVGKHRYFFKLYALDTKLGDLGEATKDDLLTAAEGHVLAEAVLMGTYEKGGG